MTDLTPMAQHPTGDQAQLWGQWLRRAGDALEADGRKIAELESDVRHWRDSYHAAAADNTRLAEKCDRLEAAVVAAIELLGPPPVGGTLLRSRL